MERDLTVGPLAGHLRALAVPAGLGLLFTTLYNVVDAYWAGRVSTEAQAGLSASYAAFMFLLAFGFGLSNGAGALIGNALGARDRDGAARVAAQALSCAAGLGLVLAALGWFAGDAALSLMGAAPGVAETAEIYLRYLFLAAPAFLISFTANGILSAQGDAQSNKRAQAAGFAANMALDPLLVFGLPGLGVPGMGFVGIVASTVCIQWTIAAHLTRKARRTRALTGARRGAFRPTAPVLRALAAQGAPSSLNMLIMSLGMFLLYAHLQPYGAAAVAGYGVAFRVEQLILLPILGVAFGAMPLFAQNHGAGDAVRVRRALTLALATALGLAALGGAALALGGAAATALFTRDPEVVASGALYLSYAATMMPAYAAMFVLVSLFQGLKIPIWSAVVGAYRQGFGLAFYPWLFAQALGWGLAGVWAGLLTAVWSGFGLALLLAAVKAGPRMGGLRPDFAALRALVRDDAAPLDNRPER